MIPDFYQRLETLQGFHFEMETIISYKAQSMLENTQSELWFVAVTKSLLHFVAALLYEVYDEYHLWWLPPNIIRFARHGHSAVLGVNQQRSRR